MEEIERHKTTLVFCNTRSLAELTFQALWRVGGPGAADRHPPWRPGRRGAAQGGGGGRDRQAARPGLHRQPRPRRRLGRRRPRRTDGGAEGRFAAGPAHRRANHRLDEPSEAILVPGNRFEYLEARAAFGAIEEGELDAESSARALSTSSPSTSWRSPARARSARRSCSARCAARRLMPASTPRPSAASSASSRAAAMSLRAYDRFKRLTRDADPGSASGASGNWRVSHPRFISSTHERRHHRRHLCSTCASATDASSARSRTCSPSTLSVGDTFFFAGLALEIERMDSLEIVVRATHKSARIPTYVGTRMAMTTHLADRVPRLSRRPRPVAALSRRRARMARGAGLSLGLPSPTSCWSRPSSTDMPLHGDLQLRSWNAHQSLGMLVTRRMEATPA